MKLLDLQKSIETFAVIDILMVLIAIGGVILGLLGFLLGGPWVYLTALMILGELILLYGILIAPNRLKTVIHRETLGPNANVWLKIAFISDLHLDKKKDKRWVKKITATLKDLKPDLLLIGGDHVVHDAVDIAGADPLKNIQTTYGSYFILGNHDYQDDPAYISQKLTNLGIHNLTNCSLSINVQGKELRLTGVDDGFYGDPKLPINRGDSNVAHMTLVHEPDMILDIKEGDTDLVLCGHTHGGQVRFPLIGALSAHSALGRKADCGRKIIKGIPTIISRGLGEVGCRARLFATPEIVIIELGI